MREEEKQEAGQRGQRSLPAALNCKDLTLNEMALLWGA